MFIRGAGVARVVGALPSLSPKYRQSHPALFSFGQSVFNQALPFVSTFTRNNMSDQRKQTTAPTIPIEKGEKKFLLPVRSEGEDEEFRMDFIDFRSDTVSWPTTEMRKAMMHAKLGDDVWGDDPTTVQLEETVAKMLGKEAGLFVTSGTQGNVCSLLAHCGRGDEIIVGDKSHIFLYEAGSSASLGGIHSHQLPVSDDGTMNLEAIERAVRVEDDHYPETRLICLENTQGTVGGAPLTAEYTDKVGVVAKKYNLKLHIDGARFFNAAVSQGVDPARLCEAADTITVCLSKGLCAPAGSVIAGPKDFIRKARRVRKSLGGGMRQTGVLAAAGIVAMEKMVDRLEEDHANALRFGEALKSGTVPHVSLKHVYTNIVYFKLDGGTSPVSPKDLSSALKDRGILLTPKSGHTFRACMHYWITTEAVDYVLNALRDILKG